MATFDAETQFGPTPNVAGTLEECGYADLASAQVSGASLSVPTKLTRVKGGVGVTSDGLQCFAAPATVSSGLAVFTRCGTANNETPRLYYKLWGV